MNITKSSLVVASTTVFTLLFLTFLSCDCKTVSSSASAESGKLSNVLYSLAKGFAAEAISEFQETARRNPRLGFNITMLPTPERNFTTGLGSDWLGTTAQLGIIGLKGGLLGLKAAIIQALVGVLFVIFLIAGIAFFACNIGVISCSNVGGSLSNLGGGLTGSQYGSISRSISEYPHNLHRATSSVYNALDEGPKKYL